MITDDDLYALGHDGSAPTVPCRPVSDVLTRGRRLRRRRHALRSAGVGAVVVTAVGTGFLVVGDGRDR